MTFAHRYVALALSCLLGVGGAACGGGSGDDGGSSSDTTRADAGADGSSTSSVVSTQPPNQTVDTCPGEDKSNCGGECVNLSTSSNHCGECGRSCPPGGFFCTGGECKCIESGLTACGDKCVDTQSNAFHCGQCGRACGPGEICKQGSCERLTEIEAIVKETNERRSQRIRCKDGSGVNPPTHDVQANAQLHKAAQYHAENMARAGFFAHDQCKDPPRRACRACGNESNCYGPGWRVRHKSDFSGSRAVGENIARGQSTPAAAIQAWVTSKTGHCKNLMNDRWNRIGVGFATDQSGTPYWVQVFGRVGK